MASVGCKWLVRTQIFLASSTSRRKTDFKTLKGRRAKLSARAITVHERFSSANNNKAWRKIRWRLAMRHDGNFWDNKTSPVLRQILFESVYYGETDFEQSSPMFIEYNMVVQYGHVCLLAQGLLLLCSGGYSILFVLIRWFRHWILPYNSSSVLYFACLFQSGFRPYPRLQYRAMIVKRCGGRLDDVILQVVMTRTNDVKTFIAVCDISSGYSA